MKSIRSQLHDIAGVGALHLSGDLHSRIINEEDAETKEFAVLLGEINNIRAINPEIKYAYTLRRNENGDVVFVVDSDPDTNERAAIGYKMSEITPAIEEAFSTKRSIMVETEYYTDEWGTFISGYAPFYTKDGRFEGLLGIDITADTVKKHQIKNMLIISAVSFLVAFFSVLLSLYVSGKITRPVAEVTADMTEIQKFNLEHTASIYSRIFEINEMARALENMKKSLRSFKKYVPSELVADLIRLNKEAVLEAEKKEITVFFSDIAGFTSISEKIPPELLSRTLGDYLSFITKTILRQQGTVDKFIGDAVMALWGAPHKLSGHELYACRAALECRAGLEKFNLILAEKKIPAFLTRIGINIGEAIVGNMGYEERLSYTAIGDNVNLASRLEGLNKFYHTDIIISGAVYEKVCKSVLAKFIDIAAVKGKNHGIRIYELVSMLDQADSRQQQRICRYNEAMELYLNRKWQDAMSIFNELKNGDDFLCSMMTERCRNFIKNPPPDGWVGVIHLREK